MDERKRTTLRNFIYALVGMMIVFGGAYFGNFLPFMEQNQGEIADAVVDVIDGAVEDEVEVPVESNDDSEGQTSDDTETSF